MAQSNQQWVRLTLRNLAGFMPQDNMTRIIELLSKATPPGTVVYVDRAGGEEHALYLPPKAAAATDDEMTTLVVRIEPIDKPEPDHALTPITL